MPADIRRRANAVREDVLAKNQPNEEQQPEGTEASTRAWWPVLALVVAQSLTGLVVTPQRAFYPVYLDEAMGFAAAFVSALVGSRYLAGIVSSLIGGPLCDTLGPKRTLLLGLLGYAVASVAFLVRAPWLVVFLWGVSGFAMGLHSLGGMSYLIGAAGKDRVGTLSAFYTWGITLGGAVSNPVLGAILERRGFPTFGLVVLGVSSATLLGTAAVLPRVRRSGTPGGTEGETGAPETLAESMAGMWRIVQRPTVALLGALRFLPTCYYGTMTALISLLVNRLAGKQAVAYYTAASQVAASLAQIAAGRAADRWGRRTPTLVTFSVLVISALGLAAFAGQLWSFFIFGVLGTSAAWALSTLTLCLVADTSAPNERGRVLGALHVLWNIGMIVGSLAGGLVSVATGLPFLATGLLNVLSIALAVVFFRRAAQHETVADSDAGAG